MTLTGALALAAFGALVALVVSWVFVSDRRVRRFFHGLEHEGYVEVPHDDERLAAALAALAPFRLRARLLPSVGDALQVARALRREGSTGERILAEVFRQEESPHCGTGSSYQTFHWLVFTERRSLPFRGEAFVTSRDSVHDPDRYQHLLEEHRLRRVTDGLEARFSELYALLVRGDSPDLPSRALQEAFVASAETLVLLRAPQPGLVGGVITRFTGAGWGLASQEKVATERQLRGLLAAVERISSAL